MKYEIQATEIVAMKIYKEMCSEKRVKCTGAQMNVFLSGGADITLFNKIIALK
ncbi:hypothetical protein [Aminicella lysinilytica]|uniref:Uncharacterized protein n=1 Tax=Aminicella lysinilytica TaxID=433323 RepID=A0A4R6Q0S3_9FIRM|nr:hypothetical protein [Aminicella lysinilytica]TDP49848.1 hypothetical protein EV211_14312 [Aminicella lysinilytica]